MNIYYVYIYCNEKYFYKIKNDWNIKYLPFYVGKGKNERYLRHLDVDKRSHNNILKSYISYMKLQNNNPYIFKVKENLSEKEAYKLENEIIKFIGVIYDGKGCLLNKYIDGFIYETYDRNYRNELIEKYETLVSSDVENIKINEKFINKLPEYIIERIKQYISIGFSIDECSNYFKISKDKIYYNIDANYIKTYTV